MREEIIVSGRMNELIDPHLQVWNWEIPAYLFLGGLAAGILFFAGLMTLQGKEKEFETTIKRAPLFTPLMLGIGLLFLFLDLKHKLYFVITSYSIHYTKLYEITVPTGMVEFQVMEISL